jgi:DNA-binding response OmpR family regulator
LVDDAQDDREMYAMFLSQVGGCEVSQAATGSEALAALGREAPDVVVLDVMLPEVDGTEVCRHLRRHPEHDKTAVVTLTALPLQSPAIDTMIDAGSDAVLVKPCAPELLLAEIRRVMQRGRLQRQRSAAQSARATELRARSERLQERSAQIQHGTRELLRQADHMTLSQRIKATYLDLPGLSLTLHQAARLWGFEETVCQSALDALAGEGFLTRTPDGQFQRAIA